MNQSLLSDDPTGTQGKRKILLVGKSRVTQSLLVSNLNLKVCEKEANLLMPTESKVKQYLTNVLI